jgi:hypothetical protein
MPRHSAAAIGLRYRATASLCTGTRLARCAMQSAQVGVLVAGGCDPHVPTHDQRHRVPTRKHGDACCGGSEVRPPCVNMLILDPWDAAAVEHHGTHLSCHRSHERLGGPGAQSVPESARVDRPRGDDRPRGGCRSDRGVRRPAGVGPSAWPGSGSGPDGRPEHQSMHIACQLLAVAVPRLGRVGPERRA